MVRDRQQLYGELVDRVNEARQALYQGRQAVDDPAAFARLSQALRNLDNFSQAVMAQGATS